MSIWKWTPRFSNIEADSQVTLGEGGSPLLHARRIGAALGFDRLYLKIESAQPSGSYKDRFAASAISHMVASRETHCVATTSGNTGAALAAYCAAAGIRCDIAVVETAPDDKLRQMLAYGARLVRVRNFGVDAEISDAVFESLHSIASAPDATLQISAFRYSPLGMAGVQTISYELAEQLPDVEHIFCPAGGGGLTLAVARGFVQLDANSPRIECVQPEGNDTIAGALREGDSAARAVSSTTAISGLQVASVIDGDEVVAACRASGGNGHTVTDEAVWKAQAQLARLEGVFCEPAGAVALAGAAAARNQGEVAPDAAVVCLVTGSGFKDARSLARLAATDAIPTVDVDRLATALRD